MLDIQLMIRNSFPNGNHTWQTFFVEFYFQVEIKKSCYSNCCSGPSNRLVTKLSHTRTTGCLITLRSKVNGKG